MADRIFSKGDRIDDRFELTQPLGKGAFGVVWKGVDHANEQAPIAIKFLFDKYRQDKKMVGRFVQEAKILEKVQHAGIASPIAWSAEGDVAYLAMEFIDGETLDRRFEGNAADNQPVPKEGIAWICDQLCTAVGYAHEHDIVHRDMKPKNIMVNRRGERPFLKVLDFGIAKMLVGSEIDPTTAGRVLGSVLYISPEAILSKPISNRSDIFSIGTIMYELITLRRAWARDENGEPHPFHIAISGGEMNSHVAVLKRIARGPRPKVTDIRSDLSRHVDDVIARAMAVDPADRYPTASGFALALRGALLAIDDATVTDDERPTLLSTDDIPNAFDELATESEGHEVDRDALESTRSERPPEVVVEASAPPESEPKPAPAEATPPPAPAESVDLKPIPRGTNVLPYLILAAIAAAVAVFMFIR